jgi:hypothetical protein
MILMHIPPISSETVVNIAYKDIKKKYYSEQKVQIIQYCGMVLRNAIIIHGEHN